MSLCPPIPNKGRSSLQGQAQFKMKKEKKELRERENQVKKISEAKV